MNSGENLPGFQNFNKPESAQAKVLAVESKKQKILMVSPLEGF